MFDFSTWGRLWFYTIVSRKCWTLLILQNNPQGLTFWGNATSGIASKIQWKEKEMWNNTSVQTSNVNRLGGVKFLGRGRNAKQSFRFCFFLMRNIHSFKYVVIHYKLNFTLCKKIFNEIIIIFKKKKKRNHARIGIKSPHLHSALWKSNAWTVATPPSFATFLKVYQSSFWAELLLQNLPAREPNYDESPPFISIKDPLI